MKFRAERDALLEAITTAGRAAATRGTALPALTGVRLEVTGGQLHLAGTDLDVTIQVQMQVAAGDPGVCVIPARLATDIVRGLDPGSVSFEVDDNEARIAAGPTHYAVRVLPPEEFLRLPQPGGDALTLTASDFADALR
ncbi:MAG: DNA polymerase III subunit beta, partial [Acidimicrobiia bacterium]|nr:DNA polymerase III subunit beta [Acidimicrobiia bacterium]